MFKEKWLMYEEKNKDWVNKKPFEDFGYIHKQNIQYCPATLKFVELLKQL